MKKQSKQLSRRDFVKAAGAAGAGALMTPLAAGASISDKTDRLQAAGPLRVPTRPFGKSGIDVSILSLGGMFDIEGNQLMLKQAIRWGVTHWDTADCYQRGSETGIGKYFAKYPQDREKVFLVSKSDARDPDGMSGLLERSLKRMNTDYLDLYFVHGVSNINELNDATRRWAEKAKAQKKIRLFGFSTHRNMETLLRQAPKLGYIDGIMMTYNFRNMFTDAMEDAVAACVEAGIGLTAMKTQAERSWLNSKSSDRRGVRLMESFIEQGLTEQQAKLKAVWTRPEIANICSQMPNMTILKANTAAAADPTPLSSRQMELLRQYAADTSDQYCAGCTENCENAVVGGHIPIGDIMRYHMYCQSYGHLDWSREHFKAIAPEVRQRMADSDFASAERRCPNGLPIGHLMRKALKDFG